MKTPKPKKQEPKPITAQPVGDGFIAQAKGSTRNSYTIGGGCYRRFPTNKE